MSFELINAQSTFQRAMDIAFRGLINDCVVVYLNDVTAYSKMGFDHVKHLRNIFEQCQKYGISLNPKKIIFGVNEGNILGFILSKEGIKNWSYCKTFTTHEKEINAIFSSQINFVRRFVSDFVETIKPLHELVKKEKKELFKWGKQQGVSFTNINNVIANAPSF